MFDKIVYISDKGANVKLKADADLTFNLMNLHVIFEDAEKTVLGEVDDLDGDLVKIRFLGEIKNNRLYGGTLRKPTLDASCRVINEEEIPLVTGKDESGFMLLGNSPFYNDREVFMNVNGFFSNHFAIMGNSGSGKSCGVSRVFQNMFEDQRLFPYKSNIIMFDSSAEYYNAFKDLSSINSNYNYRFISTNEIDPFAEKLRLPIYLLNEQDLALLLNVTSHSQLPIIERMLKLARIFSQTEVDANAYKNHLIAKAIMTILYTNETSPNKRNEIFSIIASCSTPEFTLESVIQGAGYTRKFRECFLIDQFGNFTESVLMTEYLNKFINPDFDNYEPEGSVFFDLDTLEKALNFTLISEGWLRNQNTYGDSVTIRVRLHSLIVGPNAKYFEYPDFVTLEQFISSLLITNGRKYQFVNINLDDVDDVFAKVIVKIYSRLIFSFAKGLSNRASIPFHLIVEEAHRYIQNDTDTFLIGYNIFDRIAKEGRKYGVILGLITQRPVEMSDTVISQCSNFLIFKMNHPADVEYIRKMVPNISDEIVEKQKTLQSGTCLAFGMAFTIPLIVRLKMPNPEPKSGNCDVVRIWDGNAGGGGNSIQTPQQPQAPQKNEEPVQPQIPQIPQGSQPIQNPNDFNPSNPFTLGQPTDAPQLMRNTNNQGKESNGLNLMGMNNNGLNLMSQPENNENNNPNNDGNNGFNLMSQPENSNNTSSDGGNGFNLMSQPEDNSSSNGLIKSATPASDDNGSNPLMQPYNSVQNYNSNVDDGALNPNNLEVPNPGNIPLGSQNFINTTDSLSPNIELPKQQPQIIIPGGQNFSPSLMEGFGDAAVSTGE